MSTRVQKGGTVFKPIARPQRARPGSEARQTSAVPESQSSVARSTPARNEGTPVSSSRTSMPPPAHIPSKPASNPPRPVDSTTQIPPVGAPIRTSNIEPFTPHVSSSATSVAVPTHSAPCPAGSSPHMITDAASATQLAPPGGGTAISTPSRAIPVIETRVNHTAPHAVAIPSGSNYTNRVRDAQQPPSTAPSASTSHVATISPTIAAGPFDLSQIDPSLQSTLANLASHGIIASEGSSGTSIMHVSANTPDGSSRDPVSRDEEAPPVYDGDVSQGRPKRKRAKRPQDVEASFDGPAKKRRSRRGSSTQPGTEGEESPTTTLGPKRRGKSRAPSAPPFDPDADPGEDLDPTTVTMASLCDDTGQGRVSSKATQVINNHAAWRAASKEKRARLRAIAEAKKYGRNIEDDDQVPAMNGGDAVESSEVNPSQGVTSSSRSPSAAPLAGPSTPGIERPAQEGTTGDDFDYSQDLSTSRYNVQVRIGANGETIIDEESLFVNRDEEDDTQNYTHVEESDTTKFVNSLTYSKKTRGSRWSAEETDLFFDALSQFGENYELISLILPGRDRKACKNKFKAEDKKNPARINFCLNNRKPFDIQTLARMTGKDFSGPTPVIRAPTPVQSKELDPSTTSEPAVTAKPKATRKKSKTPAVKDGEEILGSIDDIEQEDSLFGDDNNA